MKLLAYQTGEKLDYLKSTSSYLGWTNKATYLFSLDVFNQNINYQYWSNLAKSTFKNNTLLAKDILADYLKHYIILQKENFEDYILVDLIDQIADNINFYEIASELLNQSCGQGIEH